MEILILGLILVGLMVYASTRIKKTAAAAFEAETIETQDFVIQKPEGFLNVVGGDRKYAFEAYSKDFGGDGGGDIRLGRVNLTVLDGKTLDDSVKKLRETGEEIVDDISEVISSRRYRVIETKRVEKGVSLCGYYKIAEKDGKIYRLEALRLAETPDEFVRKIEVMVAGFELK